MKLFLPLLAGRVTRIARGFLVRVKLGMGLQALHLLAFLGLGLFTGSGFGGDAGGFAFLGFALGARFFLDLALFLALGPFGGNLRALGIELRLLGGDFRHLGAHFVELFLARLGGVLLAVGEFVGIGTTHAKLISSFFWTG